MFPASGFFVSLCFLIAIDKISTLITNLVDFKRLEGQNDKCDDFAIFQHNFQQKCTTEPNVGLIVLW